MAKHDDAKLWAFLGVFLTVIGFLLVFLTRKQDKYAMFYAKQGLVLFIAWVIVGIVNSFVWVIPFVGSYLYRNKNVKINICFAYAILFIIHILPFHSIKINREIPVYKENPLNDELVMSHGDLNHKNIIFKIINMPSSKFFSIGTKYVSHF